MPGLAPKGDTTRPLYRPDRPPRNSRLGLDQLLVQLGAPDLQAAARTAAAAVAVTLRTHRTAESVQHEGLRVLAALAKKGMQRLPPVPTAAAVAAAGGAAACVAAMVASPDAASVQGSACAALCQLARTEEGNAAVVAAAGMRAVLAAMATHRGQSRVQFHACLALGQLARTAEGRAAVVV